MDFEQRTLKREVDCTGIGLHCGDKVTIRIRPAPPETGIVFLRTDLKGHPMVKACFSNVLETTLATTVGQNGARVRTIEHLMAAFFGLGIDNAVVEVDGPEIPIMDGSAAPFVFLLRTAGVRQQRSLRRFIIIRKPFRVEDGHRSVAIFPSNELQISYTIDFDHHLLRDQHYELTFSGRDFVREISRARTFGFLKDVQRLKENGLAKGGSLDNAVVLDEFRILNEDGLRFKNEFVRHKILDFLGDLSVLGAPVIGRFVVMKSGHFLNQLALRQLMEAKRHWRLTTYNSPAEYTESRVKVPVFGMPEALPA